MEQSPSSAAARLAVVYFCVAVAGAWLGDRLLELLLIRAADGLQFHILEDSIIAATTALIIFVLLRGEFGKRLRVQNEVQQARVDLERRVDERTRELSTLLDISRIVPSTLELAPLLDLILDQLKLMIDYRGAAVFVSTPDGVTIACYHGPLPQERVQGLHFALQQAPLFRTVLERREPVVVPDMRADTPLTLAQRQEASPQIKDTIGDSRSVLCVPLLVKEEAIGMLRLDHRDANHFSAYHARLALAIATQAATAIENARLYGEARKLAALQERQRLARELHDSVSQALYGIALGTHAAREMYARQSPDIASALDYVLAQANAAVDEMRALIFELRPEALAEEGLSAALKKQVSAFRARSGVSTQLDLCEDTPLSQEAEEALYRIAQEALHNIHKHARANNVALRLCHDRGGVTLEVKDDGVGFNPSGPFPGHLGLQSMRQRAAQMGGTLEVESAAGQGTHVSVWLPATNG